MGGESSGSSCESGLGLTSSGTQTELLRMRGAQLFLVDGEESALMQSGDFIFLLVKQTQSPLAAVVATVGDVQWPVGKDSPVIRVGSKRYSFALPGLVYGLFLHEATTEDIERLEALLRHYSIFEIHSEITAGFKREQQQELPSPVQQQAAADYWTSLAPQVEKTAVKIERQIRGGASSMIKSGELAALSLRRCASAAAAVGSKGHLEVSPRMMKRIQQARRMSAVAKLFSKTLMRGAISPRGHVANGVVGSASPSNLNTPLGKAIPRMEVRSEVAVANVDAFAKVLEAVESTGRSLVESARSVGGDVTEQRYGDQTRYATQEGMGNTIGSAWTLNRTGLRMLFRATTASMAINLPRPSTFGSAQSSQSSVPSSSTSKSTICSSSSRSISPPPLQQHQHQVSDSSYVTQFPSHLPLPTKPPIRSIPTTDDRPPPRGRVVCSQPPPSSTSSRCSLPLHTPELATTSSLPSPPHPRPGSLFQQYSRPAQQSQQQQYSYRHFDQQPKNSQ